MTINYCLKITLTIFAVFVGMISGNHGVLSAETAKEIKYITIKLPADKVQMDESATQPVAETESNEGLAVDLRQLGDYSSIRAALNSSIESMFAWFKQEKLNILVLFSGLILTLMVAAIVSWLFKTFLAKKLASKISKELGQMACECLVKPMLLFVFALGIMLSSLMLIRGFPHEVFDVVVRIFVALMVASVFWAVYRLIAVLDYFLQKFSTRSTAQMNNLLADLLRKALKITLVIVAVLFIGQSILGVNITALLAGAGVAGLAVAFAARDSVANIFGSLMIVMDKPFAVGDWIKIGDTDGIVESVGFRSTRLRCLSGHLFTVPNSKIADSVVENISRRPFIKQVFALTIVYDTPSEKVDRAVAVLHEILDGHEGFDMEERPPHICFDAFNDWSLNISVILWFQTTDWFVFRHWLHDVNREILQRFNAEGIEFAFPTNTTYLAGDDSRPLTVGK